MQGHRQGQQANALPEVPMAVTRSSETHAKLIERIPKVTGQGLHERFTAIDQGPGLLKLSDRSNWPDDEDGLPQWYADAIVPEYVRRRRDRSIPAPRPGRH